MHKQSIVLSLKIVRYPKAHAMFWSCFQAEEDHGF